MYDSNIIPPALGVPTYTWFQGKNVNGHFLITVEDEFDKTCYRLGADMFSKE